MIALVLHWYLVSEVLMPCSSYPKAKTIQNRVRKQSDCLILVKKGASSRIRTEEASFASI